MHIPNPPNSNGQNNYRLEIENLLSKKTGFAKVIADKSEEINMLMNKASKSEELALQKFRKLS
jgi:mRNA (2'-O-methyladenosine-N6-)-methyltransferase